MAELKEKAFCANCKIDYSQWLSRPTCDAIVRGADHIWVAALTDIAEVLSTVWREYENVVICRFCLEEYDEVIAEQECRDEEQHCWTIDFDIVLKVLGIEGT